MTKRFTQQFNDNSGPRSTFHFFWAAEGDRRCFVMLWLVQACHQVERITVAGVPMAGREAVMVAWDAVSIVMRSWGVRTRRFIRVGPSARVSAAQVGWASQREGGRTIVDERRDDRPQSCRIEDIGCPCHTPGVPAGVSHGAHSTRTHMLDWFTESSWSVFDDMDLRALFPERIHHAGVAHNTSEEGFARRAARHLKQDVMQPTRGDELMADQSWKLFCLLLFLLLHRPVSKFSVTVEEFSDASICSALARGTHSLTEQLHLFHDPDRQRVALGPLRTGTKQHARKRSLVKSRQPVSASPERDSFPVTMKRSTNCKKKPQEVQLELHEDVRAFVPESPLVHDRDAFMKSLNTSPRGSSPGPRLGSRTLQIGGRGHRDWRALG